jgi:pyruvate formate lyase activating enzyme
MSPDDIAGWITNIERYTLHDGPGIRTTVFLKGCPLRCVWCSNPETQLSQPQLSYIVESCTVCYRCVGVCPQEAIAIEQQGEPVKIDFEKCNHCGRCVSVCNEEALVLIGRWVTAQEVSDVVVRDRVFYDHTGGGVTLSGGEPFWQAKFSSEILRLCKKEKIHTAIQTCGFVSKEQIDQILPYLDLAIIDFKHFNKDIHQQLTGKSNAIIKDNISYIDQKGIPIVIQIPLIPGFNDSEEVLEQAFKFTHSLKNAMGVNMLTYHTLGVAKYKHIGQEYLLNSNEIPTDYLKNIIEKCKKYNVPIIQFMGEGLTQT